MCAVLSGLLLELDLGYFVFESGTGVFLYDFDSLPAEEDRDEGLEAEGVRDRGGVRGAGV